jgi:hypothetical protein
MANEYPDQSADPSQPLSPREVLECRKLEVEIAALQRPFWKQTAFWGGVTAIVVPLLGIIVAYGSGWFDLNLL